VPTYIILGRLTTQAKRDPASSLKTRARIWDEFQKLGVKVTHDTTMGPYDVANIVEAPSG
jgi:uncharacterized protein with GYD domain